MKYLNFCFAAESSCHAIFRSTRSLGPARADRVLVNMVEGKMFAEFHSESRETLEAWLKAEGMHYDWVVRIEWETAPDGKLQIAE